MPIASDVHLERNEDTAKLIYYGLHYARGTESCKSAIFSFMCLYLFPLCDENGTVYKPSVEDCYAITMASRCTDELDDMMDLPGARGQLHIPKCLSLSNSTSILSGTN